MQWLRQALFCDQLVLWVLCLAFGQWQIALADQVLLFKLKDAPQQLSKKSSQLLSVAQREQLSQLGLSDIRPALIRNDTPLDLDAEATRNLQRWHCAQFSEQDNIDEKVADLQALPFIEYAAPNRIFRLDYVPNDPQITLQYALEKINAFGAWDLTKGSPDVPIAVIDTGVDYYHPDLGPNIWINSGEDLNRNGRVDPEDFNGIDDDNNGFVDDIRGWDFTDAPNYPDGGDYLQRDNDPMDEMGHGSSVAGIIAAVADNSLGIAGLAFGCRIMNLRAFTASGFGEEDDVASAILYALHNGSKVINMSWGDVFVSRIVDDVIRYAAAKGVVLVASAGNASTDQIHYPSCFEGVISVGSTDEKDNLSGFSNFGPTIDLVAPGSAIFTTTLNGGYTQVNGTSFSAPFVAGAAALALSQHPNLSADAVRGMLTSAAEDLGVKGWDAYFGAGRLNVAATLQQNPYALVEITFPRLDQGFAIGPIAIYGSAWSPTFASYTLSYGKGENPSDWIAIPVTEQQRIIDGLLGTWTKLPVEEGSYTIRLTVQQQDGTAQKNYVRIFIDRTPPQIEKVELLPMIDGARHSLLTQFFTDDLCEGSLFYRPSGSAQAFSETVLAYRTNELRYNLSQQEITGQVELFFQARNRSGLTSNVMQNESYFQADLGQPSIDNTEFIRSSVTLPSGRLFSRPGDFNRNGLSEIVLCEYTAQRAIGLIKIFEYQDEEFAEKFASETAMIPRDIGDADGDGLYELLGGYGFSSYLYEAENSAGFPSRLVKKWEGDGNQQYWASRMTDLDGDGRGEIILRVVQSGEKTSTDRFEVWETTGDNLFEPVFAFQNPTLGENFNGVPHCVTGDFDGDGRQEILFGDSDGDLYLYEATGDNQFRNTWDDSLPLLDSIEYLAAGDFDGDGVLEFVTGCHSDPALNTEHYYDARHWYYRIYDTIGDDRYEMRAEWRFFGFSSTKDFESGVTSADTDGDGRDEILLCVFPDFYQIEYREDEKYHLSFYEYGIQSNAALVADFMNVGVPQLLLGDGGVTQVYLSSGSTTGPVAPLDLFARPLNETQVALTWRRVPGADFYIVYRGIDPEKLVYYSTCFDASYLDDQVVASQRYYYAIASVVLGQTPSISRKSMIASAQPGIPPKLLQAKMETRTSLRLIFSKAMDRSVQAVTNYSILPDFGRATTAIHDAGGREVVLSLQQHFPSAGWFQIFCRNLYDAEGIPIDSTQSSATFRVEFPDPAPYLVAAQFLNSNTLELLFNESLDPISSQMVANYELGETNTVQQAKTSDKGPDRILLTVQVRRAWGKPITIRVENIKSAKGVAIRKGRGDAIQIVYIKTNLNDVVVFPNPCRIGLGDTKVTFANLTSSAEITIMTTTGQKIRVLREINGSGILEWDLHNQDGDPVAGGIYLYRATNGEQQVLGKFALVR